MTDWRAYARERLPKLGLRAEREAEIIEELAQQLDGAYSEACAAGVSEEAAHSAAAAQIPDWAKLAKEIRLAEEPVTGRLPEPLRASLYEQPTWGAKGTNMMNDLWQDVRYGVRMLAKNRGFTAVAVLTLALGIGLNAAIFSVVNAVLFRPLPVAAPEQLVGLYNLEPREFISHTPIAYPDYRDLRDSAKSFDGLMGYALTPLALERGDESELVFGETVTGNYFTTLGVKPHAGRLFTQDDDLNRGAHPVVVLSHAAWQQRFGGDAGIVGREIRLNGHPFTVVGVTAPKFTGLLRAIAPELWVPMAMRTALHAPTTVNVEDKAIQDVDLLDNRGRRWMWVMGRLKPGVTIEQADAEVRSIGKRLAEVYPDTNKDRTVGLLPASDVKILPGVDKVLYGTSFVLMGVVGLVLLVASANVANMLLARATARRKEMALRLALGGSRGRLVRQLLTESLLLALAGGAAGLLLAQWSNAALNGMQLPLPVQLALGLTLDFRVLAFTALLATLTAVFFGLAPALHSTRTDLVVALKEEGSRSGGARSKRRLQSALVVAQVAISLVLLIGAGLSLRSLQNAHLINPGFESQGVVVAWFQPGLRGYSQPQIENYYRTLTERIRALPGVESVALASHVPLSFEIRTDRAAPEGQDTGPDREWPDVDSAQVGPGYFATMRIPIVRGRDFAEHDNANSPCVVIANETLARRFWPNEEALGKRVRIDREKPYCTVMGVARDGKYRTLGEEPRGYLYFALLQNYPKSAGVVVRAAGPAAQMASLVRREARLLDEKVPVSSVRPLEEVISVSLLLPRSGATLFGLFGVLGLTLACVGLYGVLAFLVSQRTHEIGIRMALGAQSADILKLVVGHGLALTLVGVGIGVAGAAALTRAIAVLLYGVSSTDAATYVGVSLLLLLVALAACWIPARRASRVDPIVALRYE
jgi:predicted permease